MYKFYTKRAPAPWRMATVSSSTISAIPATGWKPSKWLMRTYVIFLSLLISFLQVSASGYGQSISINRKNVSLEEVFRLLKSETDYDFIYSKKQIAGAKKVSINVKNATITEVLDQCFQNQPLRYAIEEKTVIIRRKPGAPSSTPTTKQHTIIGKVLDKDQQPLPDATVTVKATNVSTQTDRNGNYRITPLLAQGFFVISYTGYKTQEVSFDLSTDELQIHLEEQQGNLNEVVVIGYGQTTRMLNTGSVASVTAKQIEQQPVTNVLSALSGRMAGVFVQTTNGLPGGNINVQIRGKGSIQAGTSPLYVIDGIPFDSSPIAAETSLGYSSIAGNVSPLNSLNPTDIESISVLKDADATAIYGSRGANGVVLITTKKGIKGAVVTDLNVYQGINMAADLPAMMDIKQYLSLRREAFINDGLVPSNDPNSFAYAPDLTVWSHEQNTDWANYLFGGKGNVSSAQLTLKGGSKQTGFIISGNFRREKSYLRAMNNYQRGGLHSQVSHESENRKFQLNASTTLSIDLNRMSNGQNISLSTLPPPNYPLMETSGSYNWFAGSNLLAEMLATNRISTNNVLSNVVAGYEIAERLMLRVNMGYNRIQVDQRQIYPNAALYPGTPNYTLFGANINQSFITEPQLNYQTSIGQSQLTLMAGATYQQKTGEGTYMEARNFGNEGLMENLASAGYIDARRSTQIDYRFASVFARATFIAKEKYVLNATARRDGSSRFGTGNQFGNFGAIGAAWLFSNEEWSATLLPFLSYGKIRASYGITGNDQITDYQYLPTYSNSGLVYEGVSGLQPSRIANPNLRWESTGKLETAVELGFFKDRIRFNAGYYRNRSSNQLVNYTLPEMTGFSSYQANLPAVVENTGWEFELSTSNIVSKKFRWSTDFNITLPKNQLKSFENFENSSYSRTLKLGYDITRIIGYEFLRVDPNNGQAIYATEGDDPQAMPDYYRTIGKQTPDFFGGMNNAFQWKALTLNIFLQFVGQRSVGGIFYTPGWIYGNYRHLERRWRQKGDQTDIPKASTGLDFYYGQSSANFFDSTYLRLKNVALSYDMNPGSAQNLRAYIQAQNLLTFWDANAPIADPESGALSVSQKNLPPMKSFTVGVQLTF
ncbi:SusC/RagA family TonB-linked outer membrane protein [Pedobacter deserti]|uniref:SusC/RagA family TonB-linked outer membrane protein n=1 Tax=Pedobacter deserti TaxID=2817382 RepID=UPI00210C0250|nr:SusC/RagA family TonB-linked outer membrane protein [Pedobacter sp. SYSU D00382]